MRQTLTLTLSLPHRRQRPTDQCMNRTYEPQPRVYDTCIPRVTQVKPPRLSRIRGGASEDEVRVVDARVGWDIPAPGHILGAPKREIVALMRHHVKRGLTGLKSLRHVSHRRVHESDERVVHALVREPNDKVVRCPKIHRSLHTKKTPKEKNEKSTKRRTLLRV